MDSGPLHRDNDTMSTDSEGIYFADVVYDGGIESKYLRLQDLRRLQHVEFTTRQQIEGLYSGRHSSPQRGQSVEFRDYREYIPGDDLSTVDWKVYARSDRLFIKLYEHQADLTVHLLVDGSASMQYGGDSKYDQACRLAAAIGFLITKQNDRIAFALAREGLHEHHRPAVSMSNLASILHAMEARPRDKAELAHTIHSLIATSRRRDLLIVFGDLLEDRDEIVKALSAWIQRGGEVIVFHVLHQDELSLPPVDNGVFVDSETGKRVRLNLNDIRTAYERQMREFLDGWSSVCRARGIDYNLVSVADEYHEALEKYLFRRAAMR